MDSLPSGSNIQLSTCTESHWCGASINDRFLSMPLPRVVKWYPACMEKLSKFAKELGAIKAFRRKYGLYKKVEHVPKANSQVWCVVVIGKEQAIAMRTIGKMPEESERLEAWRLY